MSSWCIGLKAGPAGFPARVRPGAGCAPGVVSGVNNPLSAFAIYVRVLLSLESSSKTLSRQRPSTWPSCQGSFRATGNVPLDIARDNPEASIEGLRGPAPRGYNGDDARSRTVTFVQAACNTTRLSTPRWGYVG
jgi:hypothetical protein